MVEQPGTSGTLARAIARLTVGNDIEQARKRMRNAWIAGFVWTVLSFMGAIAGMWGLGAEAEGEPGLGLFIVAVVEVGLVAFLSYGVLQRRRWAATLLFFYFWISRIPWILVGLISLQSGPDIARFLALQVLPAYLFLQGMRGAWTFYYLTHPRYPGVEVVQQVKVPGARPMNEGGSNGRPL
jgi:hypothetical protein